MAFKFKQMYFIINYLQLFTYFVNVAFVFFYIRNRNLYRNHFKNDIAKLWKNSNKIYSQMKENNRYVSKWRLFQRVKNYSIFGQNLFSFESVCFAWKLWLKSKIQLKVMFIYFYHCICVFGVCICCCCFEQIAELEP